MRKIIVLPMIQGAELDLNDLLAARYIGQSFCLGGPCPERKQIAIRIVNGKLESARKCKGE